VLAAASTCLGFGVRRGERRYNMKTLGFAIADLASIMSDADGEHGNCSRARRRQRAATSRAYW